MCISLHVSKKFANDKHRINLAKRRLLAQTFQTSHKLTQKRTPPAAQLPQEKKELATVRIFTEAEKPFRTCPRAMICTQTRRSMVSMVSFQTHFAPCGHLWTKEIYGCSPCNTFNRFNRHYFDVPSCFNRDKSWLTQVLSYPPGPHRPMMLHRTCTAPVAHTGPMCEAQAEDVFVAVQGVSAHVGLQVSFVELKSMLGIWF